mgnify:CR=1 FL=1
MGVTLTKIVEKMELRNLTPDVDMTQREVKFRILTVRHFNSPDFLIILIANGFSLSDM